jgi:selenide,water dikinase
MKSDVPIHIVVTMRSDFIGDCAEFSPSVPQEYRDLLFDPQTSGGLLVSIAAEAASDLLARLERQGIAARHIGSVVQKKSPLVYVK